MNKPLSNRVSNLELAANQAEGLKRDYHIFHTIMNSVGSGFEVLETIIKDGVVIRDDCGRLQPRETHSEDSL